MVAAAATAAEGLCNNPQEDAAQQPRDTFDSRRSCHRKLSTSSMSSQTHRNQHYYTYSCPWEEEPHSHGSRSS